MKDYVAAIILASGSGERMGAELPKQFLEISGKTILEYSVSAFENHLLVDDIIVVVNQKFLSFAENIFQKNGFKKVKKIISGGATRRESSFKGISEIKSPAAKVLIHDAARPLVSQRIISDCISALDKNSAVNTCIFATDTIVEVDEFMRIKSIPNRNFIMRVQTPQAFRIETIKKAHELAELNQNLVFTDDCGMVFHFGLGDIHVVKGEEKNIKITYPEDLEFVKRMLVQFF